MLGDDFDLRVCWLMLWIRKKGFQGFEARARKNKLLALTFKTRAKDTFETNEIFVTNLLQFGSFLKLLKKFAFHSTPSHFPTKTCEIETFDSTQTFDCIPSSRHSLSSMEISRFMTNYHPNADFNVCCLLSFTTIYTAKWTNSSTRLMSVNKQPVTSRALDACLCWLHVSKIIENHLVLGI